MGKLWQQWVDEVRFPYNSLESYKCLDSIIYETAEGKQYPAQLLWCDKQKNIFNVLFHHAGGSNCVATRMNLNWLDIISGPGGRLLLGQV